MTARTAAGSGAIAAAIVVAAAACVGGDAGGGTISTARVVTAPSQDYRPVIDPAAFVETIDNRYLPLEPGTTRIYEGESDGEQERIEITVTQDTKQILGVACVVVHDVVSVDGVVTEDTYDWFAQHRDGTVWYFGEDSKEYEDGEVSTAGSWEAGVDGAQPGVVMPAQPQVGDSYRQEYYPGEAEDMAEVLRLGDTVTVPAGVYTDVLVTKDWNPLEPGVVEEKFYAPGVGAVAEDTVQGGSGHVELVEVRQAP